MQFDYTNYYGNTNTYNIEVDRTYHVQWTNINDPHKHYDWVHVQKAYTRDSWYQRVLDTLKDNGYEIDTRSQLFLKVKPKKPVARKGNMSTSSSVAKLKKLKIYNELPTELKKLIDNFEPKQTKTKGDFTNDVYVSFVFDREQRKVVELTINAPSSGVGMLDYRDFEAIDGSFDDDDDDYDNGVYCEAFQNSMSKIFKGVEHVPIKLKIV